MEFFNYTHVPQFCLMFTSGACLSMMNMHETLYGATGGGNNPTRPENEALPHVDAELWCEYVLYMLL